MIRFFVLNLVLLSIASQSPANEIWGESELYPLSVRLMHSSTLPQALELCTPVLDTKSNTQYGIKCEAHPKMNFLVARQAEFNWDYYLDRCRGRLHNNRLIFGAKVLRSVLVLAGAIVTGGAAIPSMTARGVWQAAQQMAGLSGGLPLVSGATANIMFTKGSAYPDYEIPPFPSDQQKLPKQDEEPFSVKKVLKMAELQQGEYEIKIIDGVERAKQLINYIQQDGGEKATIKDQDVLALQSIIQSCNDDLLHQDLINNHAQECLAGCHSTNK